MISLVPNDAPLTEGNDCHNPGGPAGGQFCGKNGEHSAVPVEPGTTPIPDGIVRGYHYTDNLDSVLKNGLSVAHARGSTYGEPNMIWMSSQKPGDHKDYVEVHVKPEEMGIGAVPTTIQGADGTWHTATTPAEKQTILNRFNKGQSDFTLRLNEVPPSRFVTHSTEWHQHYRYIADRYPPAHPEQWGEPVKDVLQMLSGARRAGGTYVPAIAQWHREYKQALAAKKKAL